MPPGHAPARQRTNPAVWMWSVLLVARTHPRLTLRVIREWAASAPLLGHNLALFGLQILALLGLLQLGVLWWLPAIILALSMFLLGVSWGRLLGIRRLQVDIDRTLLKNPSLFLERYVRLVVDRDRQN